MRFLTVGNMYPPHHQGGYELVWQGAVEHLRAAGHDVAVLTTDHREPGAAEADEPGVERTLRWWWHDHAWPEQSPRRRLAVERHNARVFDAAVESLNPDAVGWFSMGGMSLSLIERARRRNLPAAGFVHDDWLVYGPQVDAWLRTWAAPRRALAARVVERLTGIPTRLDASAAARWLFVSEATRRRAAELGGWRLERTAVAHSGIDPGYLEQASPAGPWRTRLLCVGRLDPRKGIDTAIAAVARLGEEARLAVVGSGDADELARLRTLAADAGVGGRVEFLGPRSRAELPRAYADADAVVFPVTWEEPWGLVPLEAMACGRPVLATGRGGSGEYLRDGENALLFEAGDADALAAAVRRLAADPGLRDRLREGGLRTAPLHTADRFDAAVERALVDAASG